MRHILDLSFDELVAWLARHDLPRYRAKQIRSWLFQHAPQGFDDMTDLPKSAQELLAQEFRIFSSQIAKRRQADDGTEKLLLELADGERIECVLLIDDRDHHTACISTQVGCAMGCGFCASGADGLVRNLTPGEIIEQILHLKRLLRPDRRLTHVVVMGMGEPLANLDALLPALDTISAPDGLGISARRITISTVGLPQPIRRLADQNRRYHLAVSLHGADDELRNRLVPANRKTGIEALLAACDDFFRATGRRVTFEYVLLAGINDQPNHAERLAALLGGRPVLVNVIPFNPVADLAYRTPSPAAAARFVEILQRGGLNVKIRYRKGDRIDAACGQLRRSQDVDSTLCIPPIDRHAPLRKPPED